MLIVVLNCWSNVHIARIVFYHYLRQEGYVFASVGLSVSSWITEQLVDEFRRNSFKEWEL